MPRAPRRQDGSVTAALPGSRWLTAGGKRTMDVFVSAVLLALLWPIVAAAALAVRATSRGPALFRQWRVGRGGRPFCIWKLRTMRVDAEAVLEQDLRLRSLYLEHGYKVPVELDPRVTRVGRWLRHTSVDELPQLWNVLRGEMSLVGPRPVLPDELERYGIHREVYEALRPGITGLWQVSGRPADHEIRAGIDVAYASQLSLALDIRILLRTVGCDTDLPTFADGGRGGFEAARSSWSGRI